MILLAHWKYEISISALSVIFQNIFLTQTTYVSCLHINQVSLFVVATFLTFNIIICELVSRRVQKHNLFHLVSVHHLVCSLAGSLGHSGSITDWLYDATGTSQGGLTHEESIDLPGRLTSLIDSVYHQRLAAPTIWNTQCSLGHYQLLTCTKYLADRYLLKSTRYIWCRFISLITE